MLDHANNPLLQAAAAAAAAADRTTVPALLSDHLLHRNPFQQVRNPFIHVERHNCFVYELLVSFFYSLLSCTHR